MLTSSEHTFGILRYNIVNNLENNIDRFILNIVEIECECGNCDKRIIQPQKNPETFRSI